MMYCDVVTSTGAGGGADTFDSVGTVTLKADATRVIGIWVVAAEVTQTTGEAITGQLRVSSDDLGYGPQIALAPPYHGGGPATNADARPSLPEFIPLNWTARDPSKKVGNSRIAIEYSTNLPDPTAANAVVAGVVYEAGAVQTPQDVKDKFPERVFPSGYDTEANGAVTTVAETAITDLEVPAWAKEIVSLKQALALDAIPTAAEEVIGFIRYRSSLSDFEPQEWPLPAFGASLGTPTAGRGPTFDRTIVYGTFFKTAGVNATLTPNVVLVAASTPALAIAVEVGWR